jgi:hypothetical protein
MYGDIADLEVVHSPLREGRCIDRFVAQRARVTTASHSASARVHAILQAQRVDLICGAAHSVRELGGVWHESTGDRVTATHLRPAIVKYKILIACVLKSEVHHGIRGLHDLGLVDVAEVGILILLSASMIVGETGQTNP